MKHTTRCARALLLPVVLCALCVACSGARKGPFVIGIVMDAAPQASTLEGFKAAIKAAGLKEGTDVTYLQNGYAGNDEETVRKEVARILESRLDILVALGRFSILESAAALRGKKTPLIFAPSYDPVGEGLVKSLPHPGGNVTGIYRSFNLPKAIEHIRAFVPSAKVIYAPFDPSQPISIVDPAIISQAEKETGMKIVSFAATYPEGLIKAIPAMPEGSVILVFATPLPISGFTEAATKRGIPVVSFVSGHIQQGALFTYCMDGAAVGRQAARLVMAVMKGASPADLPVEVADSSVTLNLKTAEALGLHIDDTALQRAETIVR